MIYDTILNDDISKASIDISGGLGGYNGEIATASTDTTTTRAASGIDGLDIVRSLVELT